MEQGVQVEAWEKKIVEDQQGQGVTDENWKGRKRIQMTSSEMKVGMSLVIRERIFVTCGLGLPCSLWNSRKQVLSWSDQLSVRRKENDALAMEGLE